jgi:para-aminobenzoate N-oxygenase AurF
MTTVITTQTPRYNYQDILENSKKVAWREDDVLSDRNFDFSKRFLPNKLTGVDEIESLSDYEKLRLNQIMANAYCHLFAYVEEFIIPTVMDEAGSDVHGDEVRLRALIRFAEDELKHQEMFRRSIALFADGIGFEMDLIPDREAVAQVVRGKSPLAVLVLTTIIEWFVQLHYTEHVLGEEDLDGLVRDLLKYHWLDEAQHAKLDTLLIMETAAETAQEDREKAIDEVLELGMAIDGLLLQQIGMNVDALEKAVNRRFTAGERDEIVAKTHKAWRWTFLVSGLTHPNVIRTVGEITDHGRDKFEAAAEALSA